MPDTAAARLARVDRLPQTGMIALRADLAAGGLAEVLDGCGLALPGRRAIVPAAEGGVAWMSPDELLILCAPEAAAGLAARLSGALAGRHALVAEVSDARARFALAGPSARVALARLCPADVAPGRFGPGEVRRTRLAQVACAFWMTTDDAFELVCFRSVADYAHAALVNATRDLEGLALP